MTTFQSRAAAYAAAAAISILFPGLSAAATPAEEAIARLNASPDAFSAVRLLLGNGSPFCTIGREIDKTAIVDNDRNSVLYSPVFRAWHGRGEVTRYTEVRSNVKELFQAMKRTHCQIVVEKARNIAWLVDALEQDEMRYAILPVPLTQEDLRDAYAASLGYANHEELVLAGHMRATNDELHTYFRFGIKTSAAYDEALARMQAQEYSQDRLQLLAFLADEAEGNRRNLPPATIREERMTRNAASAK
ncbi:MAG TPA: hypothetical protein VEB70_10445 [Noviherbaspirillum sp.]|nr:hypothetical protein [Noviherbaspirillum sp.]